MKTKKTPLKKTQGPATRKMSRRERDDHFAAHLPSVFTYHATMLSDGLRNKLLYKAIKDIVNADTNFLDIGAGTGVWAILAAKLGARRVVAVEIEEALIPVIYKLAQENGVANRVEIVHGNSNDVRLKGTFDVIVSELFGGDALGAETIRSFIDVRNRFLAPGGILIPQKLAMYAVPAHFEGLIDKIPAELPLSTNYLRDLKLNYGQSIGINERSKIKFLAKAAKLVEVDFRNVEGSLTLSNLTASWKVNDLKKANAIVTFNRSVFTDTIEMDAFDSQSWGVGVNEFIPFNRKAGELVFRVTLDPKKGNWTVSVKDDPSELPQSYSPIFAFTRVRLAQKMTPHRRARKRS